MLTHQQLLPRPSAGKWTLFCALLLAVNLHAIELHAQTAPPATLPDAPAAPSAPAVSFPNFHQRQKSFLKDLLGPPAFLTPVVQAAVDTARPLKVAYPSDGFFAAGKHPAHGTVPEWGEGVQGYSKRYADRFGQGLLRTSSRYALAEALRQDVTYHRCACSGLLPRTGHAISSAFLARTRSGRTVPSLPALAAPFIASEIAVKAWYPSRFNSSDALRISAVSSFATPFKNLIAEFSTR